MIYFIIFSPEQELEEERRQKTAAVGAKKKIEGEFTDMEMAVENANKQKEEAQKQYKKMQQIVNQYTIEIEEIRSGRDDALNSGKESDKKYKLLEAELAQMQEVCKCWWQWIYTFDTCSLLSQLHSSTVVAVSLVEYMTGYI